jgi:hypothetical protein
MKSLEIGKSSAGRFSAALALVLLALSAIVAAPALRAQGQGQPARAVRLSYVDGKVQLAQDGQVLADQAVINTPLMQGTTITTAEDGKAEIQFEDGSVARIAPNSTLTLSTLAGAGTSAEADLTVESGEAYFELQSTGQAGVLRVHYGNTTVTGSGFTVLRVQFDSQPGALAVFSGDARVEGPGLSLEVRGGESLDFANGANGVAESIASDSWDAWNSDRDQALNAEAASQTNAPSDLAGGQASNPAWSDLDANGSWYNVPNQGYVWSPYDASNPGFDPYGNGNWVWEPGYGYVFASGYTWGYLPYSCGAWNYYDSFGWGWAPGLGGCNPWWGVGFYAGPVIRFAPAWYRPVNRPIAPIGGGPRRGHPIPMIAAGNRNFSGAPTGMLPLRDHNTPVNIAGATVVGLRPFAGRVSPRSGIVVRNYTGAQGNFNTGRPLYNAGRNGNTVTAPRTNGQPNGFQNGGQQQNGLQNGSQQQPNGYTVSPQPNRTYAPPFVRGNGTAPAPQQNNVQPPAGNRPNNPAPGNNVQQPSNRTYTPSSAPARTYTPPPSPQANPSNGGGGSRPSPPPSPPPANNGGGYHGGGAPSGGGGGSHGGNNGGHK